MNPENACNHFSADKFLTKPGPPAPCFPSLVYGIDNSLVSGLDIKHFFHCCIRKQLGEDGEDVLLTLEQRNQQWLVLDRALWIQ